MQEELLFVMRCTNLAASAEGAGSDPGARRFNWCSSLSCELLWGELKLKGEEGSACAEAVLPAAQRASVPAPNYVDTCASG